MSRFLWTRGRYAFNGIVEILVGPEEELFTIHKQLLCDISPYFEAAFEGEFKEAKEQRMRLPEDDVAPFKQFQFWLYSGKPLPPRDLMEHTTLTYKWNMLVHSYILGDKFEIPALQNAAIHGIIESTCTSGADHLGMLRLVYEQTTPKSHLRKLCIDLFVHMSHVEDGSTWFDDRKSQYYPREFLFDVAKGLCRRLHGKDDAMKDFRAVRSRYYI